MKQMSRFLPILNVTCCFMAKKSVKCSFLEKNRINKTSGVKKEKNVEEISPLEFLLAVTRRQQVSGGDMDSHRSFDKREDSGAECY